MKVRRADACIRAWGRVRLRSDCGSPTTGGGGALQEQKELAFRYLRLAALNHYSERELMEKDPDLASLRTEPQWREILDQMRP